MFYGHQANDHLSLSTELFFVPIITIDKIGFCVRSSPQRFAILEQ